MKPTVYLESTIPSYMASRPSRDLITAANQQITHTWWIDRRGQFDLFVSRAVIDEIEAGDIEVAKRRLNLLQGIPHLSVTDGCLSLSRALTGRGRIPARAATDALHVAIAAIHRMDYLLTWNCAHIANASLRPVIQSVCDARRCKAPIICTPQELMEM